MNKKLRKSIISLLLSVLIMSSYCMEALAAPQQNRIGLDSAELDNSIVQLDCEMTGFNYISEVVPYATTFVDASITIYFESDGMHVDIITAMNDIASVVGVKDIEVHRKRLIGYEVVAVADGGEAYNIMGGACALVYSGAVEGEKYRVVCTHYGDVDGYRELDNETDWITCNY